MKLRRRHALTLPIMAIPLVVTAFSGTACELVTNLSAPLDAGSSDALDCGICADVSVDASYDAPDVSIFGVSPSTPDAAPDAGDAKSM
jgi:hypothetical protein